MTCYRVPGGFVCTRGERQHRCACGAVATIQCDWKLHGTKKGKTCSAWVCDRCALHVAENKDLCPPHAKLWAEHPMNPKNAKAAS